MDPFHPDSLWKGLESMKPDGPSYGSIDALQQTLVEDVFHYATDRKKAAGRALGTLVEIVTYYSLRAWGVSDHIVIERRIPEFANPAISHNVEFSLHPVIDTHQVKVAPLSLPITPSKVKQHWPLLGKHDTKSVNILSKDKIRRNAAILADTDAGPIVANITDLNSSQCTLRICELSKNPFAIVECKRVGVEEGMKKGPQTIEKAKQGSYVARSVSALQKVRLRNGDFQGIIERQDGKLCSAPYHALLREIIDSPSPDDMDGFVLTIGVVSNHGNWFTSENHNKELLVLAQSYDWLLFLTDEGLGRFISDLLLKPTKKMNAANQAFLASYSGQKRSNKFTKVCMDVEADRTLQSYFSLNSADVEGWFNVISPKERSLPELRADLKALANRSCNESI